jgi:hypothetical protein
MGVDNEEGSWKWVTGGRRGKMEEKQIEGEGEKRWTPSR